MRLTVTPTEIQECANRHIVRLRQLSFAELAALPAFQEEVETINELKVAVWINRDILEDGSIRIVVQAYFHRFLGIGTMAADGFIIASNGTQTAVPQDMMWEFS